MSSDIVLTSALRTNLLSLQNTQRLIDTTQERLATGLKVNSALDNPQNFFAAQSLNNRASDLGRLLDGISQSIRTIEEADQMIAAAKKSGARLMVGHLERFNPAMVALRPHVTKPLYFEIHRVSPFPNRSLDVDVVLDVMIHDLDAIQWLVGEDIKLASIQAVGIPIVSDKVDAANARIEFENGAVANITSSRVGTEKIRKTRFYQTNSYVVLDYGTKFASVTSLNPEADHPLLGISINRLEIDDVEPLRAELSAFLASIANGIAPPITAEDGRRALELAINVVE